MEASAAAPHPPDWRRGGGAGGRDGGVRRREGHGVPRVRNRGGDGAQCDGACSETRTRGAVLDGQP